MLDAQYTALKTKLSHYLDDKQLSEIDLAYSMACDAHEGQYRMSGEPYVSHPVEVASILADLRMDPPTIISAILHDVIEDTEIEKLTIQNKFDSKISEIVDGVSKLTKIKFEDNAQAQAHNLRKMILAMAKDIRVIIVKLADRLHNMRTIEALPRKKRRKKALETLEIYAPIANRLGINNFKVELEDLGFKTLYPMRYRVLKQALLRARGNRKEIVSTILNNIKTRLKETEIETLDILGREKHLHSLYCKMKEKHLTIHEIMDVYAFRIVLKTVSQCYQVLGVMHGLYKPLPGLFKDYIAIPKANGYQSLHTVLKGPFGVPMEIQIRTREMDRIAQNGVAAHWVYKTPEMQEIMLQSRAQEWLTGLLEVQEEADTSVEFIENVKLDLYPDHIYVFTPKGKILSLPLVATPIDFAYAVHTDVGNSAVAVKIDRKLAPLSSKLKTGQTIEIVTAAGAHPSPAWLGFVNTAKARSNIRAWLKLQHHDEAAAFGRRLLERSLASSSLSIEDIDKNRVKAYLQSVGLDTITALFTEIGLGNRLAEIVARSLANPPSDTKQDITSIGPIAIKGTEGIVVNYAKCCYPIPGDPIVAFLSTGKGITVHHESCKNIKGLSTHPEKVIHVCWFEEIQGDFCTHIRIDVQNQRGVLATLAATISETNANIINLYFEEKDGRQDTLSFVIHVKSRAHLAKVMRHLRHVSSVIRIIRVRS